jgi:hypothetical protein
MGDMLLSCDRSFREDLDRGAGECTELIASSPIAEAAEHCRLIRFSR